MIHNVHNNNLIIMIGPVLFLAPTVVDHDWLLVTLVGDINFWSTDQLVIYWSTSDHNAHISCRSVLDCSIRHIPRPTLSMRNKARPFPMFRMDCKKNTKLNQIILKQIAGFPLTAGWMEARNCRDLLLNKLLQLRPLPLLTPQIHNYKYKCTNTNTTNT